MTYPSPALGPGPPLRRQRILRYVTAFCPHCHHQDPFRPLDQVRRLSGWLAEQDGQVRLERGCPEHGLVSTLYEEHADILRYLERWTARTKDHTPDRVGNYLPIPAAYAHGLPAMQTQHTCILVQDVTQHCNLRCPTCFADAGPSVGPPPFVPVAQLLANLDARIGREGGRLDVVMLSGGEPTLHPDLPALLAALAQRPIVRILLNTNGIRLASDDALVDLLHQHHSRVEVYLQYDGPSSAASQQLRGGDLRRHKELAIQRLSAAEVFTTVTMTVAAGVNDRDIGHVIQRALDTPYLGGVSLQPQFDSGRAAHTTDRERLTHTGVLASLAEQTGGQVQWSDLTALPCSHPHCASVGYLIRDDAGQWRSLAAVLGHDALASWLDLAPEQLANRVADRDLPDQVRAGVKASLLGLLSEQSSLSHPGVGDLWNGLCSACDLGVGTLTALASSRLPGGAQRLRRLLAERVVRLTVKPFMDISTMLEERLIQCCVHVGTRGDDGADQCAPFCAVQAWPALAQQRLVPWSLDSLRPAALSGGPGCP